MQHDYNKRIRKSIGPIEFTQAYGLHKDADKRDSTILLGGMEKLKAYILKEQCSDE
jgi:hypothetical protein